ncbi:hypothetical protein M885DRAFT_247840 [Pelagophyceae sp. CCMP2097]|nr:hypothetical protein M885DRAFT_247840 [Pelagophyceae sp. CCMP2097]
MAPNATDCASVRVVLVPNRGRLGNAMFQYAVCRAIVRSSVPHTTRCRVGDGAAPGLSETESCERRPGKALVVAAVRASPEIHRHAAPELSRGRILRPSRRHCGAERVGRPGAAGPASRQGRHDSANRSPPSAPSAAAPQGERGSGCRSRRRGGRATTSNPQGSSSAAI